MLRQIFILVCTYFGVKSMQKFGKFKIAVLSQTHPAYGWSWFLHKIVSRFLWSCIWRWDPSSSTKGGWKGRPKPQTRRTCLCKKSWSRSWWANQSLGTKKFRKQCYWWLFSSLFTIFFAKIWRDSNPQSSVPIAEMITTSPCRQGGNEI
jgi:hypothetical protein